MEEKQNINLHSFHDSEPNYWLVFGKLILILKPRITTKIRTISLTNTQFATISIKKKSSDALDSQRFGMATTFLNRTHSKSGKLFPPKHRRSIPLLSTSSLIAAPKIEYSPTSQEFPFLILSTACDQENL